MKHHDLSANLVKLDYPTLLLTARIAVGCTKNEIERKLSQIQKDSLYKGKIGELDAASLVESAKSFEIAVNTLNAIEGMKERGEIELMNLPSFPK